MGKQQDRADMEKNKRSPQESHRHMKSSPMWRGHFTSTRSTKLQTKWRLTAIAEEEEGEGPHTPNGWESKLVLLRTIAHEAISPRTRGENGFPWATCTLSIHGASSSEMSSSNEAGLLGTSLLQTPQSIASHQVWQLKSSEHFPHGWPHKTG